MSEGEDGDDPRDEPPPCIFGEEIDAAVNCVPQEILVFARPWEEAASYANALPELPPALGGGRIVGARAPDNQTATHDIFYLGYVFQVLIIVTGDPTLCQYEQWIRQWHWLKNGDDFDPDNGWHRDYAAIGGLKGLYTNTNIGPYAALGKLENNFPNPSYAYHADAPGVSQALPKNFQKRSRPVATVAQIQIEVTDKSGSRRCSTSPFTLRAWLDPGAGAAARKHAWDGVQGSTSGLDYAPGEGRWECPNDGGPRPGGKLERPDIY